MKIIPDEGAPIIIGTTEATPTIGIVDFSRRVTDDFGVTTVVQRGFARRMSVRLALPYDDVDALQRQLTDLRATPARWEASDELAWLSVRGFYKDFSLDLAVPPLSFCTLTIEGLAETETVADSDEDPATAGQASTLQLLQPVVITDGALASSSVGEDSSPAWSDAIAYSAGAQVHRAETHRVYENLSGTNTAVPPETDITNWLDVGPTNRWAMFDQALGTVTSAVAPIVVTINPGAINAVALLDVVGATVRVQAPDYDRLMAVSGGAVTFLDLPDTAGPISVSVSGSGTVSVGTLLVGRLIGLGVTEASPTAGITDFSRKETDDFGEVTIVERAWAKRMSVQALIRTDAVDLVANRVASVRAQPCLWIGQEGKDSLTIYGFFKDFSIEVGQSVSKLSLSVEGLSTAAPVRPAFGVVDWPDVVDSDPVNHPKPADGATNGADPASPLGPDKTVGQVLSDLDINSETILRAILTSATLAEVLDLRTLLEGQTVGTKIIEERETRITETSALVTILDAIAAVSPDGASWIVKAENVRSGDGTVVATALEELGAASADQEAKVTQLREVVIGEDGEAEARAVVRVDAHGNMAGITTAAGEDYSHVGIVAGRTLIAKPDGTVLAVFGVDDDDLAYIPNLKVDTLKVDTANVPVRATGSSSIVGTDGASHWSGLTTNIVFTAVIEMRAPGWIQIVSGVKLNFPSGPGMWRLELQVDGTIISSSVRGGGATVDDVTPLGAYYASTVGDYVVAMRFGANSNVTLMGRDMFVNGMPFTGG